MTTIPTSSSPIHLPDVLPKYSRTPILDAKLRKLAAVGYVRLEEQEPTK